MKRSRTLGLAVPLLIGLATAASSARAGNPIFDYFWSGGYYEGPPPAGNCRVLVDRHGLDAVWHGEFSGKRRDIYNYNYYPYFGSGCFLTEHACRIWQARSMTALFGGLSIATRCHRPVPNWELR